MRPRLHLATLLLVGATLLVPASRIEAQDLEMLRGEALRTEAALRTELHRTPPQADATQSVVAGRRAALATIGEILACGDAERARREWSAFVRAERPPPNELNELVQFVIRQSYLESLEDMRSHREKVEFINAVKAALQAELAEARQALIRPGDEASGVEVMERVSSEDAEIVTRYVREHRATDCPQASTNFSLPSLEPVRTKLHSRDAVVRRQSELEQRLSGLTGDAQLSAVDLQKAIIRAQGHMQRLSTISKELHDIAIAKN